MSDNEALRVVGLTRADLGRLAAAQAELIVRTPQIIIPLHTASLAVDTASRDGADSDDVRLQIGSADQALAEKARKGADAGRYRLLGEPLAVSLILASENVHGYAGPLGKRYCRGDG